MSITVAMHPPTQHIIILYVPITTSHSFSYSLFVPLIADKLVTTIVVAYYSLMIFRLVNVTDLGQKHLVSLCATGKTAGCTV